EENLQAIIWPRETEVSFEILGGGKKVMLDVDLPDISEMPNRNATVPQRGYRLQIKEMSIGQVRKLYMGHVHGVGFRIIGETFADLPAVETVVLSTSAQRTDHATGGLCRQYLYSVRVRRNEWQR